MWFEKLGRNDNVPILGAFSAKSLERLKEDGDYNPRVKLENRKDLNAILKRHKSDGSQIDRDIYGKPPPRTPRRSRRPPRETNTTLLEAAKPSVSNALPPGQKNSTVTFVNLPPTAQSSLSTATPVEPSFGTISTTASLLPNDDMESLSKRMTAQTPPSKHKLRGSTTARPK